MAPRSAGLTAALLVTAVLAAPAAAQDIVVDDETITAHDIDQRTRFDLLATHKTPSRQQVIDELHRETLALHAARRRPGDVNVSDAAVEQAYAKMAARMRLTPAQLTAALANQGIGTATLKRRIRADLARQQLLRLDPLWERHGPLRWCANCLRVSDAGAAIGLTPEQQKCLESMSRMRKSTQPTLRWPAA